MKPAHLFAALTVITTINAQSLSAGLIDDYFQQTSGGGPSSIESQSRGFMTGGNYSGRWQTGSDRAFSFTTPSISMGCGGIDINTGSLSYLNFDQLVQKLQGILQNAPAVAVDMALSTLCEQCSQAMKSFGAFVDQFSALQVDDCQASKALVATIKNGLSSDDKQKQNTLNSVNQMVSGGASEWYKGVNTKFGSFLSDASTASTQVWNHMKSVFTPSTTTYTDDEGNPQTITREDPLTKDCPIILSYILPDKEGEAKSLLKEIAHTRRGLPEEYIDTMRGFIGDILFIRTSNSIRILPVDACPSQQENGISRFLNNDGVKAQKKTVDSNGFTKCEDASDTTTNFQKYAYDSMLSIMAKMKNKEGLDATTEYPMLNTSPFALSRTLRLAIATGQESNIAYQMSKLQAVTMAFYLIADMHSMMSESLGDLEKTIKTASVARPGCRIEDVEVDIDAEIKTFKDKMWKGLQIAESMYQSQTQQMDSINNLLLGLKKTQDQLYEQVAANFGASVASKVFGR